MGEITDAERRPRVALVHDFLLDLRGAERVFLELCAMWPDADIYTCVYDETGTERRFVDRPVHTSFLQKLHPSARTFRMLLPLYPAAVEAFDLSSYDIVVSSSSAWAHAVLCEPETVHVCYCHNPFRYAWNDRDRTLQRCRDPITRAILRDAFRRWRQWDWIAAQRVDRYLANSLITQARIRAYFGRESDVVHPPVDTRRFSPGAVGDYYAVVSELMPHKGIDVAIDAFNELRRPLVVVGDGPCARELRRRGGPTVQLTGRLSDTEVARVLSGARALIQTSVEEFGIAAVEAQAAGRPVIARQGGGALETVIAGETGCFWSGGPRELADAVRGFDPLAVDPAACVDNARRFDAASFRRGILHAVDDAGAAATPTRGARERPQASPRGLLRRAARDAQHH